MLKTEEKGFLCLDSVFAVCVSEDWQLFSTTHQIMSVVSAIGTKFIVTVYTNQVSSL